MKPHTPLLILLLLSAVSPSSRRLQDDSEHSEEDYGPGFEVEEVEIVGQDPLSEEIETPPDNIKFSQGPDTDYMTEFKTIKKELAIFEEEYKKCIAEISSEAYSQDKVDECVGENFIKVVLDVKYSTFKMMSRYEERLRDFFIKGCYALAEDDKIFSLSCDYLERDTLDLMWNGLDIVGILQLNKLKYLSEYAVMPRKTFKSIIYYLTVFSKDFFNLLDEIDDQKEKMIINIKIHVDERTNEILGDAPEEADEGESTVTQTITVHDEIHQDEPEAAVDVTEYDDENSENGDEGHQTTTRARVMKGRVKRIIVGPTKQHRYLPATFANPLRRLKAAGSYSASKSQLQARAALQQVDRKLKNYISAGPLKTRNIHTTYLKAQKANR